MLTTTRSLSARARRTKEAWPSCNAPIVGTNPTLQPAALSLSRRDRSSDTPSTILIGGRPPAWRDPRGPTARWTLRDEATARSSRRTPPASREHVLLSLRYAPRSSPHRHARAAR